MLTTIPFVLVKVLVPSGTLTLLNTSTKLVKLKQGCIEVVLVTAPFFVSGCAFATFTEGSKTPSVTVVNSVDKDVFGVVFSCVFVFPINLKFSKTKLTATVYPVMAVDIYAVRCEDDEGRMNFC